MQQDIYSLTKYVLSQFASVISSEVCLLATNFILTNVITLLISHWMYWVIRRS